MRIILHLDMDAFFAAVEERDEPRFKGRPIVVGADPRGGKGRGVVSTANYAARKYGIRSAMPISEAWRRAEEARKRGGPETVFLGGSFKKYGEVSERIMKLMRAKAKVVEQVSVDEAFADVSHLEDFKKAETFARALKEEIRKKERLTCSIGVGPNKLIAKIASDREKPDGLTVVKPEEVLGFLAELPIRVIPGIGPKTESALAKKGISTIARLREVPLEVLVSDFGKWGSALYEKARGEDDSPVEEGGEVKSIGEQETFEEDTKDMNTLTARLKFLASEVHRRFTASDFTTFKTVVLTVRFSDFETKSRAHTLPKPERAKSAIEFETLKLLLPFMDRRENPRGKKIRLIGVRVEKLT
ncbi:MAG: DNA polymerase IV [Candidatus Brennerbacteria bacterium]